MIFQFLISWVCKKKYEEDIWKDAKRDGYDSEIADEYEWQTFLNRVSETMKYLDKFNDLEKLSERILSTFVFEKSEDRIAWIEEKWFAMIESGKMKEVKKQMKDMEKAFPNNADVFAAEIDVFEETEKDSLALETADKAMRKYEKNQIQDGDVENLLYSCLSIYQTMNRVSAAEKIQGILGADDFLDDEDFDDFGSGDELFEEMDDQMPEEFHDFMHTVAITIRTDMETEAGDKIPGTAQLLRRGYLKNEVTNIIFAKTVESMFENPDPERVFDTILNLNYSQFSDEELDGLAAVEAPINSPLVKKYFDLRNLSGMKKKKEAIMDAWSYFEDYVERVHQGAADRSYAEFRIYEQFGNCESDAFVYLVWYLMQKNHMDNELVLASTSFLNLFEFEGEQIEDDARKLAGIPMKSQN